MTLDPKSMKTIVGVVDGFREGPLDEDVWPAIYYPMYQSPDNYVSAVVRTQRIGCGAAAGADGGGARGRSRIWESSTRPR